MLLDLLGKYSSANVLFVPPLRLIFSCINFFFFFFLREWIHMCTVYSAVAVILQVVINPFRFTSRSWCFDIFYNSDIVQNGNCTRTTATQKDDNLFGLLVSKPFFAYLHNSNSSTHSPTQLTQSYYITFFLSFYNFFPTFLHGNTSWVINTNLVIYT